MPKLPEHVARRDSEVRAAVTEAMRDSLRELARRDNVTMARVVRRAIADYLRRLNIRPGTPMPHSNGELPTRRQAR